MSRQNLIVFSVKAVSNIQLFLSGLNSQMKITIFLWSQQRCVTVYSVIRLDMIVGNFLQCLGYDMPIILFRLYLI